MYIYDIYIQIYKTRTLKLGLTVNCNRIGMQTLNYIDYNKQSVQLFISSGVVKIDHHLHAKKNP